MSLWTELKDRFLKFETLHGLYWIPTGIIGIYVVLFHIEYVIEVAAIWLFIFLILEGLYKLLHNPVKKQAAITRKAKAYSVPPTPPAASGGA